MNLTRIRNKKPEDLDEVVISKTSNLETVADDVKSLESGEDSVDAEEVSDSAESLEADEVSTDMESKEAEEVSTDMESSELEEPMEENTDEHSEN